MGTASQLLPREAGAWLEVLVDEAAAGAAPAFVLLPSSQRDAHDLQALAKALQRRGHTVLRPLPRGMGRSSAPGPDLSLHTLAADVACAIERLLGRPAIVAGHAFGHFIARVADLEHPRWVCGVAVIAGAARVFPKGLAQALDVAADPERPRQERVAALQHAFFAPGHDASAWLEGWHPHLAAAYRRAGSMPAKDLWWPVSHAPVLDLQAAHDPWRPPGTRDELREVLGDKVTVHVVPDASHALPAEQPEAVAHALSDWAVRA
ncbi:alpha/beta hydrolase [Ramlibacter sp. AW1]|uniref:Alpha/beta hydrolase n=1 Tax=Ramlibacter aurantiacus TaxID=2801330 RepID=A0A936ZNA3_9BURK|nr:alpha/beta hydrolase [Ramlibacter aurantiacus]MBL0420796.1 alpha/beta hydrolase [Ramlibacter aurantiacus]